MPDIRSTSTLPPQSASAAPASMAGLVDQWCRSLVLRHLDRFDQGVLEIVEPDGGSIQVGGAGSRSGSGSHESGVLSARLRIRDWRTYRLMASGGALGAGEAWVEGFWDADDLVPVIRFFAANLRNLRPLESGLARLGRPLRQWLHQLNRNSIDGSRRNIAAHYDLGNDFFALFLDTHMMYSSAVFREESWSLEQAAEYKLDLVCQKLDLRPHHHLLEIGTGWGGLAIWAAQHYGCRVTTTTISRQQYEFARGRVAEAGLEDRVTVLDCDYRLLEERLGGGVGTVQFDRIVSIEMIEAVGHQYLQSYFSCLGRLLRDDGLLLIQAITVPERRYDFARRNVDFIKRHIFPGGFLPAVAVMQAHLARFTSLGMLSLEDIGQDYARTLHHWRRRFLQSRAAVQGQGFDERFLRAWDYYLAYCEGAFLERATSTVQLVAAGPRWRPEPN